MAETATRNYDVKAVTRQQAVAYQSFGWIRSKEPVPEDLKYKSKQPLVLLKRKLEFGLNPKLSEYEKSYEKLEKKKYRSKPVLSGKGAAASYFHDIAHILKCHLHIPPL